MGSIRSFICGSDLSQKPSPVVWYFDGHIARTNVDSHRNFHSHQVATQQLITAVPYYGIGSNIAFLL